MPGAFGLNECHLPRVPRERFVEANPRIDVWELHQCGALLDGTTTELRVGSSPSRVYQVTVRRPNLWIDETCVLIVWDEPIPGVGRPWFECRCGRRVRHLYLRDPIACRRCHGLRFSSQYLGQQTPGVQRVMRWRRQLGVDPAPFSPIPNRPVHHVRYHRKVALIRIEEERMAAHLQNVCHDLERRIVVRKAKGQWKS